MGGTSDEVDGMEEVDIVVCVNSYMVCAKSSIFQDWFIQLTSDFEHSDNEGVPHHYVAWFLCQWHHSTHAEVPKMASEF